MKIFSTILGLFNHCFDWIKKLCGKRRKKNVDSIHSAEDELNIVQSMAKCKKLHKRLCVLAHPDKHPDKEELATAIMNEVNNNRFNYSELTKLEQRIKEEL